MPIISDSVHSSPQWPLLIEFVLFQVKLNWNFIECFHYLNNNRPSTVSCDSSVERVALAIQLLPVCWQVEASPSTPTRPFCSSSFGRRSKRFTSKAPRRGSCLESPVFPFYCTAFRLPFYSTRQFLSRTIWNLHSGNSYWNLVTGGNYLFIS